MAYGICFNVSHKVTTAKQFITSHNVILNNCLTGIDVYAHTQLHQLAEMVGLMVHMLVVLENDAK